MISPYLQSYLKAKLSGEKHFELSDLKNLTINNVNLNLVDIICTDKRCQEFDHLQLLKECLALGLPMNDYSKAYPVIFSTLNTRPDMALCLLKNGACDSELKQYGEKNPEMNLLTKAVTIKMQPEYIKERIEILDFLFEKCDYSPHMITHWNLNLLQSTKDFTILQWLLDKGVDPLKISSIGINAVDLYQKQGNLEVVAFLKNHIAQKECVEIIHKINGKHQNTGFKVKNIL